MRFIYKRLILSVQISLSVRSFATSYSGRITREDSTGRTITVEIDSPNIVRDIRGYALPRRDLICRVSRILQSPSRYDPLLELSEYLQNFSLTLSPAEVSEVLKALRNVKVAIEFFHFCSSLPGYRHDCFTYNRIFSVIAKFGADVGLVGLLLDEMEKEGVRGNISTINILISLFGGGELKRCLELLKMWSLRFNGYTYKCLLQAYLRSCEVENALEVYCAMRRKGYKLDIFGYNMLLDALAKADKVLFIKDEFFSVSFDV